MRPTKRRIKLSGLTSGSRGMSASARDLTLRAIDSWDAVPTSFGQAILGWTKHAPISTTSGRQTG